MRMTIAIILSLQVISGLNADWPVFRGNSEMNGTGSSKLPDQLDELWVFKCKDSIESAPVVHKGVVYAASMDKHLYAIDLKTGKEIWKLSLGSPLKAAPAIAKDRIYVGDVDGKFHAIENSTGKKLWSFEAGAEITGGANFFQELILFGSHDNTLYCLFADGKKKWEYKIDGPVNGAPAIADDRTFVAGCDSLLHVINIPDGKVVGSVDLGGQSAATAAVTGDLVIVGTMTNQVVAVDWKKLKKAWEFEPKRRQQPFYSSAAISQDLVVTGSRDRKVYALDRATGQEKWNFVTEGAVDPSPVIIGNRVFIGCLSTTGEFYTLDLKTGKQIQVLSLDSAVSGSVAVGSDRILVGTEKGSLYCFGQK